MEKGANPAAVAAATEATDAPSPADVLQKKLVRQLDFTSVSGAALATPAAKAPNNIDNETARREAIEATLERNPNAFRPKIASSPHAVRENRAANAAITGAVGSSGLGTPTTSRKRKNHGLYFANAIKDQPVHRLGQLLQANNIKTSATSTSSSIPMGRPINHTGSSKVTYRSVLADVIQPEDVKELCTALVVVSGEVAKKYEGRTGLGWPIIEFFDPAGNQDVKEAHTESSLHPSNQNNEMPIQKEASDGGANGSLNISNETELGNNERPVSPGTLALMCDEQDTFMASTSQSGAAENIRALPPRFPHGQGVSDLYAEQERRVLTEFRNCLRKLSDFAKLRADKRYASSGARNEPNSQPQPVANGTAKPKPPTNSEIMRTVNAVAIAAATNNCVAPKIPTRPLENGAMKPNNEKLN
ncbi:Protein tesmin/TSO1-like CXC 5 [Acorus calamus]|uniref:Protein tesmin/TSO1-like CXC 5 n=1 Tax=Acorus calamus TaxID=4465 RepID=A0AAV9D9I0_ACOCL|nr:Protein tesmin/TSO1-like CXC 5 [Acorus calamus]